MTDQYQSNNINGPRTPRTVIAATVLTLDDNLIVANSAAGIFNVTLPNAAQIPGNQVTIKAPVANVNNVTVNTVAAQTIDGAATFVMNVVQQTLVVQSDGTNWRIIQAAGATGADANAIHVNVAGEIAGIALKAAPVNADLMVIEDSADANNKKRITAGTLPFFNQTTAGQISGTALKAAPIAADTIVINDSAAANAVRSATLGSIPIAQAQVASIVVQVGADGAAAILNTTGGIQLAASNAGNKVIATTSSYAGQKVDIILIAGAGGNYTLPLDAGILTFTAAVGPESAVVERNSSNTAWVCIGLRGAIIV